MIMYAQYLMDRYLGKKGQGLTEYAIVLLLVVMIGVVIWQGSGIYDQLTKMYNAINKDLGTITTSAKL